MSSVASVRRLYDADPALVVPHIVSPLQLEKILQQDRVTEFVGHRSFEVVLIRGCFP
jgi:hypothetical protein